MSWNSLTRQTHRWLSIAFTAIVAGIFASLALGITPARWVYYLPLPPLLLMLLTGLYLFALPYLAKGRREAQG